MLNIKKLNCLTKGMWDQCLTWKRSTKVLEKTNVIPMEVFVIKILVDGNINVWKGNKESQDKEVAMRMGKTRRCVMRQGKQKRYVIMVH